MSDHLAPLRHYLDHLRVRPRVFFSKDVLDLTPGANPTRIKWPAIRHGYTQVDYPESARGTWHWSGARLGRAYVFAPRDPEHALQLVKDELVRRDPVALKPAPAEADVIFRNQFPDLDSTEVAANAHKGGYVPVRNPDRKPGQPDRTLKGRGQPYVKASVPEDQRWAAVLRALLPRPNKR